MTDPMPGPTIIEVDEEPTRPAELGPAPTIIETDDARPMETEVASAPPATMVPPPQDRRTPIKLALAGLGLLVGGIVLIDALSWLTGLFEHSVLLGTAASACVAAGAAGIGYWILGEFRGLARLRQVEQRRIALSSGGPRSLSDVQQELAAALAALPKEPDVSATIAAYRRQLEPHHSGAQRIELFCRLTLHPLDSRAKSIIGASAAQTAGMTLLVPTLLGDTVFFALRGIRLVRQIAGIYGHRPGAAETMHLLRRILMGAATVGAVDITVNVAANALVEFAGLAASPAQDSWRTSLPRPPRAPSLRNGWPG